LDELVASARLTQSQAIRDALVGARRDHLGRRLLAKAEACRDDSLDLAEAQALADEMSQRRAW
jgi:hypothetical protein